MDPRYKHVKVFLELASPACVAAHLWGSSRPSAKPFALQRPLKTRKCQKFHAVFEGLRRSGSALKTPLKWLGYFKVDKRQHKVDKKSGLALFTLLNQIHIGHTFRTLYRKKKVLPVQLPTAKYEAHFTEGKRRMGFGQSGRNDTKRKAKKNSIRAM